MIYSDVSLRRLQKEGFLPNDVHIGPSSVDLRLSNSFCIPKNSLWDLNRSEESYVIDVMDELSFDQFTAESLIISPGEFILASTEEEIGVPHDCAGYVEGRSSVGRIGIQVQNAGFVDAGFRGQITLELQNQSMYSIRIHRGMRICQLVYVQMTSMCDNPYNGKYQFQTGATSSMIYKDDEFVNKSS